MFYNRFYWAFLIYLNILMKFESFYLNSLILIGLVFSIFLTLENLIAVSLNLESGEFSSFE